VTASAPPLRIGVSACLAGQDVRFDGSHKLHPYLAQLGEIAELVPVCPEVELGLGIPREKIQLVDSPAGVRLVTAEDWYDITADMLRYARARVRDPELEDLAGYILKSRSPSCGVRQVKLYSAPGEQASFRRTGRGLFAGALIEHFPLLPIIEEDALDDPVGREDFLRRVRAYRDLHGGQGQA
jgi:uncharacterized protein YbbK (DUF523 family)